ncbi:MAG: aldose 1-epimerase family protein [Clostridia bacterium]|nr:aldose 1-epimerase family protein [Clostridia bacterium]
MENIKIRNAFLKAEISCDGAELISVADMDGNDFLWCGDSSIWSGHAPVLFPICGALKDGKYTWQGKEFKLEKHGFIRHKKFECVKSSENSAEFRYVSDESTKESYPFDFEFSVRFELEENNMRITYLTVNKSDCPMYFSCGAHEAYACPEGIEEYSVSFENDSVLDLYRSINAGILEENSTPLPLDNGSLHLEKKMFENDALIFKNHKSRKICLSKNGGGRKITVDFNGFDYLLIWTKPEGDYICLEPWTGIPDSTSSKGILAEKEGITRLEIGKTFDVTHIITFE